MQLDFTIKYAECDLADKRIESHPVVHMYYSNQYVRDIETGGVVYIHLNEDKLNTQYTGSIIATLDRKHDGIPPMSGIGICSYAVHRNDLGHACYVNVGTSHVFMGDILGEIQKQGYYDHNHELMMRTVVVAGLEPVKKGVLEFRINAVSLGKELLAPGPYGNRGGGGPRMSTVASLLQEPISSIAANLEGYIQASVEAETKIPDALPNVGRVRVPMDISEVGAEFSKGAFLPAAAYAMLETPQANAEFFRNSFEVIMARRNMTIADYHDFSEHDKTRTMARMISAAVQLFDYIGDAVELGTRNDRFFKRRHVGNEEFGKIWATLTGDCEDSSGGIASVLKAYIAVADFNPTIDAHLIEMQKMAKHDYVPLQTLAVVHGQKIGDQEGFGAHMYLTLLPTHYVEEGLRKTYLGRQFLDQLEPAVVPVGSSSSSSSYFEGVRGGIHTQNSTTQRSLLHEDRPVLICEGTGIIDPIGHPGSFPMIDQYRYVMSHMPSLRSGKCEIPRVQGEPSSFYYALMSTITDKYIDEGINIGAFVLGQENKQHNPMDPANAHEMSRGALFIDLIRGKDTLAISPQPPIPEPTMRLMEEANAFVCPPRPLVLDRKKPIAGAGKHAPWDKFVSTVASFGRPKGNKAAGSVKFYYRPYHYNDNFINKLISEVAQAPNVWAADYVVEHWTNGIYNIRLELYVH